MTHTYAILEVSPAAYAEIRAKLHAAGYDHAFGEDDGAEVIDMHGIAVKAAVAAEPAAEHEWASSRSGTLRYVQGEGWLFQADGLAPVRLVDPQNGRFEGAFSDGSRESWVRTPHGSSEQTSPEEGSSR